MHARVRQARRHVRQAPGRAGPPRVVDRRPFGDGGVRDDSDSSAHCRSRPARHRIGCDPARHRHPSRLRAQGSARFGPFGIGEWDPWGGWRDRLSQDQADRPPNSSTGTCSSGSPQGSVSCRSCSISSSFVPASTIRSGGRFDYIGAVGLAIGLVAPPARRLERQRVGVAVRTDAWLPCRRLRVPAGVVGLV